MSYLNHVVTTKGFIHSFERSAQILKRFCMGRRKFLQMISFLQRDLDGGAKITFCVTASLLWENALLFRKLRQMGHDVAAHGYIHTNMKNKSRREQIDIIRKCSRAFAQFRMPVSGFRCPYLSYNDDTLDVLQRGGFAWTSNNMILWPNGSGRRQRPGEQDPEQDHQPLQHRLCGQPPGPAEVQGPLPRHTRSRARTTRCSSRGSGSRRRRRSSEVWMNVLRQTHEKGRAFPSPLPPRALSPHKGLHQGDRRRIEAVRRARMGRVPHGDHRMVEAAEGPRLRARGDGRRLRQDVGKDAGEGHDAGKAAAAGRPAGARQPFFGSYVLARPVDRRNGSEAFPCVEGTEGHHRPLGARCSRRRRCSSGRRASSSSARPSRRARRFHRRLPHVLARRTRRPCSPEIEDSPFPVLRLWRWPDGMRSAFTISADVDSVTLMDFVRRAMKF